MSNPLKIKNLVRGAWCVVGAAALVECGGRQHAQEPEPAAPLPTASLAAQQVGITPLTLIAAEDSLRWQNVIGERRAALVKADSVIGALLQARAPEVAWLLPEVLRRATRRAPGIAPDPDRMGTALLVHGTRQQPEMVPDPLRSELRTLAALAGGGRFILVPAGLVFRRSGGQADGQSGGAAARPTAGLPGRLTGMAELTVVMVDVRTGRVGFRTLARGEGDDPWTALTGAVKSLTPGLP